MGYDYLPHFLHALPCDNPQPTEVSDELSHAPDHLQRLWREYGFAPFGQGLWWTVDPTGVWGALGRDALAASGTAASEGTVLVARSAFGALVFWDPEHGMTPRIFPATGEIEYPDDRDLILGGQADKACGLGLASLSDNYGDLRDADDELLFGRALARWGALNHDEVFGFTPALTLGGSPSMATLSKQPAIEHVAVLLSL